MSAIIHIQANKKDAKILHDEVSGINRALNEIENSPITRAARELSLSIEKMQFSKSQFAELTKAFKESYDRLQRFEEVKHYPLHIYIKPLKMPSWIEEEYINYDPRTQPNEYYQQVQKERRKLKEALIALGEKLSKRRKKLLRIRKHLVKLVYSNTIYADLRRDLRKVVRDSKPSRGDDEDGSFLSTIESAVQSTNRVLRELTKSKLLRYENQNIRYY
ncbi:MAG: hypothetical protein QNK23_16400 [Crocinitomicaceae bacterium]|nr:hypothetical protein [Crocinitomicaceae bacterium]